MQGIPSLTSRSGSVLPDDPTPQTREETAKQFEEIMVQEFVKIMTADMFKTSLAGEEGPGWMASQSDTQRQILTDVLAEALIKQRIFNFSDQILDQLPQENPD